MGTLGQVDLVQRIQRLPLGLIMLGLVEQFDRRPLIQRFENIPQMADHCRFVRLDRSDLALGRAFDFRHVGHQ